MPKLNDKVSSNLVSFPPGDKQSQRVLADAYMVLTEPRKNQPNLEFLRQSARIFAAPFCIGIRSTPQAAERPTSKKRDDKIVGV